MTIVAVAGDASTTTAVALASAWPIDSETLLVEADPGGGDLAAWFDMPVTPSLSTVVTNFGAGAWSDIEPNCREAGSGLRVIPAPPRAVEANQAVGEASRRLVGMLGAMRTPVTIADTGRISASPASHPFVAAATVSVIVHRQSDQSPGAAAVRLQRLADQIDSFERLATNPIVAVIGAVPFSLDEIESFITEAVSAVPVVGLPVDGLAAAVLAGRPGVSAKRLARLPLLKASRDLAAAVYRTLDRVDVGWSSIAAQEATG